MSRHLKPFSTAWVTAAAEEKVTFRVDRRLSSFLMTLTWTVVNAGFQMLMLDKMVSGTWEAMKTLVRLTKMVLSAK